MVALAGNEVRRQRMAKTRKKAKTAKTNVRSTKGTSTDGRTDRVINHLPAAVSAPERCKSLRADACKAGTNTSCRPAIGRAGDVVVVVCPSTGRTIFPYDPVTTERAKMCVMRWPGAVSRRDASADVSRQKLGGHGKVPVIIRQPLLCQGPERD